MSNFLAPTNNVLPPILCGRCQEIFVKVSSYPPWPSGVVTQPSRTKIGFPGKLGKTPPNEPAILVDFHNIQALYNSSSDGCHLCKLFAANLDPEDITVLLDELADKPEVACDQLKVLIWRMDSQLVVRLQESEPKDGYMNEHHLLDLTYLETDDLPTYSAAFTTSSSSTASFETFSKIHSWLWECHNNHPECMKVRQQQHQVKSPTRLIHVGKFASESVVRLVESRDLPQQALERRYITLSHCWGSTAGTKLTIARYNEFLEGLELTSLPPTFQDAITLTRYLGMDYIWIDCMCIIQDSPTDWETESYQMSDIYHGSFLNIGANTYYNSNGGLFHERDPYIVTPLRKTLRWPPGRGSLQTVAFFPISPGGDSSNMANYPLSERGWVAQERLLAPRTLHFTTQKVLYECPSMTVSESDATGALEGSMREVRRNWASLPEELDTPARRADTCLDKWDKAVRMYTQGDLTFQSDKLVAISGLASRLKSLWNDESVRYLAGLWSRRLETSLLWQVLDRGKRADTIADHRAPSWSWAAVRGEVLACRPEKGGFPITYLAKVLQAETRPLGHPLGPVDGGFLRIRGPLCVVTAIQDQDGNYSTFQLNGTQINFRELSPDGHSFIDPTGPHSKELFLLGICIVRGYEISLHGLVLRPTGTHPGEYIRVGIWETGHEDMTIEDNRKIVELFSGGEAIDADELSKDFELILKAFKEPVSQKKAFEKRYRGRKFLTYTIKII